MLWINKGAPDMEISREELNSLIEKLLSDLGKREKVLILPPDITRFHSRAGEITDRIWEYYGDAVHAVMPALGTHYPMTREEKAKMFTRVPDRLFMEHDWRNAPVEVGTVPGEYVKEISEGAVSFPVPLEINDTVVNGGHDLIVSVGQVVPHEVIGMANHNKNIFVGAGGAECINKSHFIGAAYGMERIMGRADSPVRKVFDYGSEHFIPDLPIVYILTVIGENKEGKQVIKGLYAGDDRECFNLASELSLKVNFTMLDKPVKKMVVYLEPDEFRSTWLGNKAVYRTRMAMADGGELVILAPGLKEFGEDKLIDKLIRTYGYKGRKKVLELVETNEDLKNNLGTAAHLIHGSSDGRFKITYCPGKLTREEIEGVGFGYLPLDEALECYNPEKLGNGWNTLDTGEEIYYISNPALGLWTSKDRFEN